MRIVKFLLTLTFFLLFSGAAYQYSTEKSDSSNVPGQFYQVGDNTYHLLCEGDVGPTLFFESGRWGWYADWTPLWQLLSPTQRKCTYDRLGLGWSSKNSNPTYSNDVADDLNRLLTVAGIDEKLVVIAHSLGGLYARKFYELYPERVAGLVLLDSTHEEVPERLSWPPENFSEIALCSAIAWTGALRLYGAMDMLVPEEAPRHHAQEILSAAYRTRFCSGLIMAARGGELELKSSAAPRSLGSLPLVVVHRGKGVDDYVGLEGETREFFVENEPIWYEMQKELASLSSRSKILIAHSSGHEIQTEEPDKVVEAINIILAWLVEE